MKVLGVVYLITCLINGMKYVGQTTKSLNIRISQHKCGNLQIDKAIKEFGWENFTVEVLETCSVEQLNEREKFWIIKLNCKYPNGYNFTDGGEGGWRHSEKTKAIIAAGKLGEKNPQYGKPNTTEQRLKISIKNRNNSPYKNLIAEMDRSWLTYSALANLLNLSLTSLAYKIRGMRNFTANEKDKLEEIFGKPIEYFLQRDDGKICISVTGYSPYKNLLAELYKRRLTCTALAKLMESSLTSVCYKVRGERNFTDKDKAKLVEIFGKPIEYLLQRDDT